jgi:hypothetical protein
MVKPVTYCLFMIALLFTNVTIAQDQASADFDLYILMGQSNMAGRGTVTDNLAAAGHDRVFVWNKDLQWTLAKHPLHFDKPAAAGVGPGLAFGTKMANANKKVRIGLIPCAVGGTKIEYWVPGAYDPATKTHPYDDAVVRIKAAMRYGKVKGVIWHQGEANSDRARLKNYPEQLATLIKRVRDLTGDPNLPFIAGELGRFYANSADFNVQLQQLPKQVPFTGVVSSKGLQHKGDQVHFDGPSANQLGERYAKKMLNIQRHRKR